MTIGLGEVERSTVQSWLTVIDPVLKSTGRSSQLRLLIFTTTLTLAPIVK